MFEKLKINPRLSTTAHIAQSAWIATWMALGIVAILLWTMYIHYVPGMWGRFWIMAFIIAGVVGLLWGSVFWVQRVETKTMMARADTFFDTSDVMHEIYYALRYGKNTNGSDISSVERLSNGRMMITLDTGAAENYEQRFILDLNNALTEVPTEKEFADAQAHHAAD